MLRDSIGLSDELPAFTPHLRRQKNNGYQEISLPREAPRGLHSYSARNSVLAGGRYAFAFLVYLCEVVIQLGCDTRTNRYLRYHFAVASDELKCRTGHVELDALDAEESRKNAVIGGVHCGDYSCYRICSR